MKTENKKLFGTILVTLLLFSTLFWGYNRQNSSKNFIIKYAGKISKYDSTKYHIENLKGYYTEVTIRLNSDSSYTVVYWGDRNSWLWDFKKDYYYTIDVPYDRYKGKDVTKDIEILNIIKDIK